MNASNESYHLTGSGFGANVAARVSLSCVVVAGLFSFTIPAVADVATAILVLMAFSLLINNRVNYRRLPLILAGIWMVFVVASAIHATSLALPGHHFKSLGKHLPIALGPLVAIPLSAACTRLRLRNDVILVLFFSGLIVGALFVLIRNDAIGLIVQGWSNTDHSFLGRINRNFAALACGVCLITAASLLHYLLSEVGRSPNWTLAAAPLLALIIVFVGKLLILMQSRTAYLATAVGLTVWLGSLIALAFLRPRAETKTINWIFPIIIIAVVLAISAINLPIISQRFNGAAGLYFQIVVDFMLGRPVQIAAIPSDGPDRLHMVAVAFDLIHQRPWLGWGPDASRLLEIFSPFPGIRNLSQFHNGYMQVLVSFGVVGAALLLALLLSLVWSAFDALAQVDPSVRLSPPLFAAVLSLILYLSITNTTESITFVKPAAMICMLFAALACIQSRKLGEPSLTASTPES